MTDIRIGIDLGGTKIEIVALDNQGNTLLQRRIPTPKGDYDHSVQAVTELVVAAEAQLGSRCSVGIGMPGSFSPTTGLVRNANSTWLNGRPFDQDLQHRLAREIRFANDANCLALSEATDGAGAGCPVVFAIIIGTGVGGGLALNGAVHQGRNLVAAEWGHTPLPWMTTDEYPGPPCYCGRRGCIETFVSGTGFSRDYFEHTGRQLTGEAIISAANSGDSEAQACFNRYQERLARAMAGVTNTLDPDVFVLGGGMSNLQPLYSNLPSLISKAVFGGEFTTPIRPAQHGDASGVRGAAWLW